MIKNHGIGDRFCKVQKTFHFMDKQRPNYLCVPLILIGKIANKAKWSVSIHDHEEVDHDKY